MSTKTNKKENYKVEELFLDKGERVVSRDKAATFRRIFTANKKVIKILNIPIKDMKYYSDIYNFDKGGVVSAEYEKKLTDMESYINDCKEQLSAGGIKKHSLLGVMIKRVLERNKQLEEQLEEAEEQLTAPEQEGDPSDAQDAPDVIAEDVAQEDPAQAV